MPRKRIAIDLNEVERLIKLGIFFLRWVYYIFYINDSKGKEQDEIDKYVLRETFTYNFKKFK